MLFVCRSRFECPASSLYEFHAGSKGFSTLVGLSPGVKVLTAPESLLPGARAVVELRFLFFLRIRWTALHIEHSFGERFVDVQEKGPFRSFRHSHLFLEGEGNTSFLEDRVECELPRPLSIALFEFLLLQKMKKEFLRRHEITAKAIGCEHRNEFCQRI